MVDSVSVFGCRLVDPSLSGEERAAIGIGPDSLVPQAVKARKWWNPWGAAAGRKAAVRELERPYELVAVLAAMQRDAVRFRDLAAAQPATADVAHETARSLAWLLWHTADRIDEIANRQDLLREAGGGGGEAKALWRQQRYAEIEQLWAPVVQAAADIAALAAQAEETMYASRIALERDPAVELVAPTAREITAADDVEAAADALAALREAWTELDVRLRRPEG